MFISKTKISNNIASYSQNIIQDATILANTTTKETKTFLVLTTATILGGHRQWTFTFSSLYGQHFPCETTKKRKTSMMTSQNGVCFRPYPCETPSGHRL
ncbi:uncharacterized protein DS421_19g653800 [Arachis hypogaea]|uniref:Uncharacterized protein n=1 Tax=Arachis hypogaea TaxID=3818 RepID=A0A6B9V8A6_ARAHY|nr:uncharacterized protein DS421_19g653800 [Arachis hypogaea]